MEYRIDNKKINIKNLKLIGSGSEGNVFKYRSYALKIKHNDELGLSYDDCFYMMHTRTSNILLPKGIFYKNGRYSGYVTKYIPKGNNFNLTDLKSSDLVSKVLLPLDEDLRVLAKRNILLSDVSTDNIAKNKSLFLIDPGCYTITYDLKSRSINELNREEVRCLLNTIINQELRKYKLSYEIGECDNFSYYMKENINDDLSVKEFVLKK